MKHACLFLLFCCQVSAQNDQAFANWLEYTQGEAVIIAPAGLNLREKPTLQSRVLRSIAFGEK